MLQSSCILRHIMDIKAYAKINLGLYVIGKRPDGFHNIETIFYHIKLFDELHLSPANDITLSCTNPKIPTDHNNLCWKAVELLQKELGTTHGVKISLKKNIPIGAGLGGGHDEREQTLNQILVEMDGFEQTDNVIVLAATNRPDVLDPALLRPGRFDRQVTMELPDIREREAIMRIHSRLVPTAEGVDLRNIAERTPGFSGADLANLVNEAAILAARHDQDKVTQENLEESIEKVLLGPERRSKVFSEKEKKVTAYHEAGHAVVAYYSPEADPVRKISIISRGHAGGYTLKLPEEDKHLHTRTSFWSELATLMGGYTAELLKFKELPTGASNDLRQATNLARKIVTDFGMSKLGPITYGHKEEYVFLGKELHEAKTYSESTAAKIDEHIAELLRTAQTKAEEILTKYAEKLELIAQTLLRKETIGQAEFLALMTGKAVPDTSAANPSPEKATDASEKPAGSPDTAPAAA